MHFPRKVLSVCLLVLGFAMASPSFAASDDALSAAQRTQIEEIIHQYLLNNPKVIIEAVNRMQVAEDAAKKANAKQALANSHEQLINDPDAPIGGNPKGDVTVVEFFDYRCGYCKKVHPSLIKLIDSDKNLRFVYKEFPILGPQSIIASKAALAVSRIAPAKYQEYHDVLMTSQGALTKAIVLKMAANVGIDADAVGKEMEVPEIEKIIHKNYKLAQQLNINGTPAFVIGDQLLPGAADYDTLKDMIAKARGS